MQSKSPKKKEEKPKNFFKIMLEIFPKSIKTAYSYL
jgi:hypothetical protein